MHEHTCELLRAHGINAYAQGDEIVVYAASTSRWVEVKRFSAQYLSLWFTEQETANRVAHAVADLVTGPHTHDLTPSAALA